MAIIWVNLITTEPCSPEPWKSWFILGKSSPFLAQQFRLVKYYNFPGIMVYWFIEGSLEVKLPTIWTVEKQR